MTQRKLYKGYRETLFKKLPEFDLKKKNKKLITESFPLFFVIISFGSFGDIGPLSCDFCHFFRLWRPISPKLQNMTICFSILIKQS